MYLSASAAKSLFLQPASDAADAAAGLVLVVVALYGNGTHGADKPICIQLHPSGAQIACNDDFVRTHKALVGHGELTRLAKLPTLPEKPSAKIPP
jgi:hypothetical protein